MCKKSFSFMIFPFKLKGMAVFYEDNFLLNRIKGFMMKKHLTLDNYSYDDIVDVRISKDFIEFDVRGYNIFEKEYLTLYLKYLKQSEIEKIKEILSKKEIKCNQIHQFN